jgi:hypothetical protein
MILNIKLPDNGSAWARKHSSTVSYIISVNPIVDLSCLCDCYVDGYIKTNIGVHKIGRISLILSMVVMQGTWLRSLCYWVEVLIY